MIIGKSIETFPCRPARRIARTWVTKSLAFSKKIRVDRQPMNGLASPRRPRYGTVLSPPRSSVRIVTVWPGELVMICR